MNYRVKNIGIAIGLAALAAILTSVYVVNYKRHVQRGEGKVTVLVAARDIPAGTSGADVVDQKMLKEQTVPAQGNRRGRDLHARPALPVRRHAGRLRGRAGQHAALRSAEEQGIRSQIKGTQRAYQLPGDCRPAARRHDPERRPRGRRGHLAGQRTAERWQRDRGQPRHHPRRARASRAAKARRRPRSRLPVRAARPSSFASPTRRHRSCSGFRRTAKATARATTSRCARRRTRSTVRTRSRTRTRCSSTDPEGGRDEHRNGDNSA